MDATEEIPLLDSNGTRIFTKSLPKGMVDAQPPADNIVEGDDFYDDDPENPVSNTYMMILLPVVGIVLLIALAAAFRWRYKINHSPGENRKSKPSVNNNDISKSEEGIIQTETEESAPLKTRNASTSSSSTVSRDILIEGSKPVTVNMRIVSGNQSSEILKSNRTDLYCELSPRDTKSMVESAETPNDTVVKNVCEILKEKTTENFEKEDDLQNNTVKFKQEDKPEATFPKRPKTLQVVTIADSSKTASNANCSKGFSWGEQLWTPDAEIIYEDTGSPENACDLQKEDQDCLFPLMAKGRFKMKPKGLLERRGSNVALTISLKSEEKTCASPPPSSKSPKPLVYLRTATAKLDPVQLHIKAADTSRLQQEFWEVPMNHPSEKHFSIPGYGTKNRYRSILPNPHSRVLLPATPDGDPLSAYINANYIRGFSALSEGERRKQSEDGKENEDRRMSMKRKAGFIATQGPMANTIVDFWKMVWRENSTAIVMITKLKERKEKCSEYMPATIGDVRKYDQFEIEIKNVKYADHYTVRTVEVRNLEEEGEVRTITHYWYAEWLDHETPDKLRSLLTLVQEVDHRCPDVTNTDSGPVVVHCSAGIGRTGCFIAISVGCRQLRVEGKVDPLRIICQLRMDRGGMIQTWEQYQYVHVALSRYARILAGENVNTPLTASSTRTPDSRGSSRHSTPVSGGVDFKSPQNNSRLFSPKSYTKPELSTVVETENGVNGNNDANLNQAPKSNETNKSIFSPHPGDVSRKSRFSFSCTEDLNAPPNPNSNPTDEAKSSQIVVDPSKRTKKPSPPQLSLKLNPTLAPVRNENWLVNGHCNVEDNEDNCDETNDEIFENLGQKIPVAAEDSDSVNHNGCSPDTSDFDNQDFGKLKNMLSPTAKDRLSSTDGENEQKSGVFMFPDTKK